MPVLVVLVTLTLAVSRWLLEPLVSVVGPLLNLSWLGWGVLLLLLWVFAGGRR